MFELSSSWIDFLNGHAGALQVIAAVIVVLLSISAADDLFVDACFWSRRAWRALTAPPGDAGLEPEALLDRPEQPIAIMLPAWREHDVIAAMVENAIRTLDYSDYQIFIGVYPNDAQTRAEVERLTQRHRRVSRVEAPRDGPTSKADCLNGIVADIMRAEATTGRRFAGVVMHDCEDVLHPLELKFFNAQLPERDLVQLPVVALERAYHELVAGTYMDEFAEAHAKDLIVRQALTGTVPSAGVGTCLSRKAITALSRDGQGEPFNLQTLTEDYDVGTRLSKAGLTGAMAHFPVTFRVTRHRFLGLGAAYRKTFVMPLCVREYFPKTFRTAYRQKARWTLGIAIQGWVQQGWQRSLAANYFLCRDRKALIAPGIVIAAYLVLLNYALLALASVVTRFEDPSLFPDRPWVYALLGFNLVAMILRAVQRFYFVDRIYGPGQALMALPRMAVGNVVNFAASVRAVRIYAEHLLFGRPIVWDKTAHQFPSDAVLAHDHRRLGEILTAWRVIDQTQLEQALEDQRLSDGLLGRRLMDRGLLEEETLAEALAVQAGLERARFTLDQVGASAAMLPLALCQDARLLPLGHTTDAEPLIASVGPLSDDHMARLLAALRRPPKVVIARESEIDAGLRLLGDDEKEIGRRSSSLVSAAPSGRRRPGGRSPLSLLLVGSAALAAASAVPGPTLAQTADAQADVQDQAQDQAQAAYDALAHNRPADAVAAAERAVAAAPENLEWRLLLTDAYLRAGRPADALVALQPLADRDDYAVQSRLAEAADAAGRTEAAQKAYARAAVLAPDAASRAFLARAHAAALVKLGRKDEARSAFDAALASGALKVSDALDLAYLAQSVGDDRTALAAFHQAEAEGALAGASTLDAAYAARRLGRDGDAIRFFKRGLDSDVSGQFELEPQARFDVRREVATLERRWTAIGVIGRGVGAVAPGAAGARPGGAVQGGGEVFARLGGYRSGRPIVAFARAFQTLDVENDAAVGFDTTQAWLGLRWKPLAQSNLLLEGSRMVAIGDRARNDWMARLGWSADEGADLRVDRTAWPMWRVYVDIARIIEDEQTIALIELRAGRTFRVRGRATLSPYAVVRADYDDSLAGSEALGAGLGLTWRAWVRETRYSAPSSYVEASLEYRARLSGDQRAEGVFVTLGFTY